MELINTLKHTTKLFFNNKKSYEYIEKKTNWYNPLILVTVAFFIGNLAIFLTTFNKSNLITMILTLMLIPIILFTISGIFHLFFMIFKGKRHYKDTLKFISSMLVIPSLGLSTFIILGLISTFSDILLTIVVILLYLIIYAYIPWQIVLFVDIFKKVHKLETGKTYLVYILSIFLMIIIVSIVFAIFISIIGIENFYQIPTP